MLTGVLSGLAAGALSGLLFIAPRMAPGLSSVDLTAGRFLSYGVLSFALMVFVRQSARPTLRQALSALGLSVLGYTGFYLMLVLAIRDAGTVVPSLIIGTIPIWMMLLGKPAGLRWAGLIPGLVLTLLGLGLMMQSSHGASDTAAAAAPVFAHFWRGVAFAVASMALWTAFGILNARWLKTHPEVNATTWANWLGMATGLGALGLWLVAGTDAKTLFKAADTAQAATIFIVTGIGSAWLATYLWNVASQRLPASLCGQLIVSETIFALVYSFVWDSRMPSVLQAVACGLFICGIFASIRAHR